MRARVHNAKMCTADGSDCWIASITDDDGRLVTSGDNVSEHDDECGAIEWSIAQLKSRGISPPYVDLDDGSYIRADLPRKS